MKLTISDTQVFDHKMMLDQLWDACDVCTNVQEHTLARARACDKLISSKQKSRIETCFSFSFFFSKR